MFCFYCDKKIMVAEEYIKIYVDDYRWATLHGFECYKKYDEEFLSGKSALDRGYILGMCGCCHKPVRQKDLYLISRVVDKDDINKEMTVNTSFPKGNELCFRHNECHEKVKLRKVLSDGL